MTDPFRNYDKWLTRTPEDEADERERRRQRDEFLAEQADYEHDRRKDEPEDE